MSCSLSGGRMGKWVAQRVQRGTVKVKLGRKTKVCLQLVLVKCNVSNDGLHVIGLHGPGDKISLFLDE